MKNKALLSSMVAALLVCGTLYAAAQTQDQAQVKQQTAQVQTGGIRGTVTDPTGALIPSSTVTISNKDGYSKSITSSGDGSFAINHLEPGRYSHFCHRAGICFLWAA
jgi:hypothetical protein